MSLREGVPERGCFVKGCLGEEISTLLSMSHLPAEM